MQESLGNEKVLVNGLKPSTLTKTFFFLNRFSGYPYRAFNMDWENIKINIQCLVNEFVF